MSFVTLGFVEATAAAVTAAAALGVLREARSIAAAVRANTGRSRAAAARSTGNRRFLRWLTPRVLEGDDYRQPAEFDPDPAAVRTDGGDTTDA